MKTLKKNDEIVRKDNEEAKVLVSQGWAYVKKSEWKKIRGPVKVQESIKHPDQPWKDKRGKKKEVVKTDEEVKEVVPVTHIQTAAEVMSGGDRNMTVAMEITGQEDRKKKGKKGKK
jgi:hypothetical protein